MVSPSVLTFNFHMETTEKQIVITSLNEYQQRALDTDTYPHNILGTSARFMGLSGEAGEATDKAKKEIRDHHFFDSDAFQNDQRNHDMALELGDVLWYISTIANDLGYTLQQIAEMNINKLADRLNRDKIHGSGDHR